MYHAAKAYLDHFQLSICELRESALQGILHLAEGQSDSGHVRICRNNLHLISSEVTCNPHDQPQLIYIGLAWKQGLSSCHLYQKATWTIKSKFSTFSKAIVGRLMYKMAI